MLQHASFATDTLISFFISIERGHHGSHRTALHVLQFSLRRRSDDVDSRLLADLGVRSGGPKVKMPEIVTDRKVREDFKDKVEVVMAVFVLTGFVYKKINKKDNS